METIRHSTAVYAKGDIASSEHYYLGGRSFGYQTLLNRKFIQIKIVHKPMAVDHGYASQTETDEEAEQAYLENKLFHTTRNFGR